MTTIVVHGPTSIKGTTTVPGDKSISHRALMLAAVAQGESHLTNLGPGEDVAATKRCLGSYGIRIRSDGGVTGSRAWSAPSATLDCGNSGSTLRMLAGLASHHAFTSVLDGDGSLRSRPMDRIVAPLEALGARVATTKGRPPVKVEGGKLVGAEVATGIASAQVKSSALFAGLAAEGETSVTEPSRSRDHTERLLAALGAPIKEAHGADGRHTVWLRTFEAPPFDLEIPGDPSAAAFLVTAAILTGSVRIDDVGLNPTRITLFEVMKRMGAAVRWETTADRMGEPVGTIVAERSDIGSVGIEGPIVPLIQDELPLLAVIATQTRGTTTVTGAGELRTKESDRITSMSAALRLLGADVEEAPDGFTVNGPTRLTGTKVDAAGDHRVAMALAVAGLVADGDTLVDGFESAGVSWPGFDRVLASLGADVEVRPTGPAR